MTKKEQISEMAEDVICLSTVSNAEIDDKATIHLLEFIDNMYRMGYRKIPENAVVLTMEEYIDLSRNYVGEQIEKARKETAKEILQCLYDKCYEIQNLRECFAHIIPLDILTLAKEYGVEVEE